MNNEGLESWKKSYTTDQFYSKVLNVFWVNGNKDRNYPQYQVIEGLIYFKDWNGNLRLCIPHVEVMSEVHNVLTESAHRGHAKTYNCIASTYYWPKMSWDIKKICLHLWHLPEGWTSKTRSGQTAPTYPYTISAFWSGIYGFYPGITFVVWIWQHPGCCESTDIFPFSPLLFIVSITFLISFRSYYLNHAIWKLRIYSYIFPIKNAFYLTIGTLGTCSKHIKHVPTY